MTVNAAQKIGFKSKQENISNSDTESCKIDLFDPRIFSGSFPSGGKLSNGKLEAKSPPSECVTEEITKIGGSLLPGSKEQRECEDFAFLREHKCERIDRILMMASSFERAELVQSILRLIPKDHAF